MKYCMTYYGEEIPLSKEVDEINIELARVKHLERDLLDFCEIHKNQRINLIIDDYNTAIDKEWIPYIFDFQQEHKEYNIFIRLPYIDDKIYSALKKKYTDMKFYLNIYAKDWTTLYGLIKEGVHDVFIVEELGFDIITAAAVAHSSGVRVRVFPNVAQSSWEAIPPQKKFWIRPEDTELYEDYIDVYEFYGELKQQTIFYDVYKNDKKWSGNLNNLIIGLKDDINSMCLLPRFGDKRRYCQHRCFKGVDCQMCDLIVDLSKKLEENKLRIKIDKSEEEEENGERNSEQSDNI